MTMLTFGSKFLDLFLNNTDTKKMTNIMIIYTKRTAKSKLDKNIIKSFMLYPVLNVFRIKYTKGFLNISIKSHFINVHSMLLHICLKTAKHNTIPVKVKISVNIPNDKPVTAKILPL